jgi:erythromycin esterase
MKAAGGRVRFRTGPHFLPFLVLTWATVLPLWPGERVSTGDKVAWFASNAVTLRSISPKDRDYSDLRAIRLAIGTARVVLLGGGNDGAIVGARGRLVRFLHEEMGFDVLTSDVPLFDAEEFDRPLDQGKAPRPDLQELNARYFAAYTPPYSGFDILEYARGTHKTDSPLHIAGFGRAVSTYMVTEYSKRLSQFLDRVDPQLDSLADRKAIQALLTLCGPVRNVYGGMGLRMFQLGPQQWEKTFPPGLAAIARLYEGLGRRPAEDPNVSEITFYRQTLANLGYVAKVRAQRSLALLPADSVVALAKIWRPASKIIVWSGNWTVGRDWPPINRPNGGPPAPARSTGSEVARVFGGDAYAIAFSEIKNQNGVLQVLEAGSGPKLAPVDGDLESLLHAAGKPFSFVDFRSVPKDHWLRTPLSARLVNGSDVAIWPDHFDGLVTVDLPVWKERK